MLYLTVQGQSLSCQQDAAVSDSVDYILCRFIFDSDWNGLDKTAQFTQNGTTYNMVLSEDCCRVPNEISAGEFSLSVFGVKAGETLRITTDKVTVRMLCSGYVTSGTSPVPPTPDLYAQLLEKIEKEVGKVPNTVDAYITDKKVLTQNDVLQIPSASSALPISGAAQAEAFDTFQKTYITPLQDIAYSGSYSDLMNTPVIPSKTGDLQNDAGFITSSDLPQKVSELANDVGYITAASVPTKVSELQNDSGYITAESVPTKTSELENDSDFLSIPMVYGSRIIYYDESSNDICFGGETVGTHVFTRYGKIRISSSTSNITITAGDADDPAGGTNAKLKLSSTGGTEIQNIVTPTEDTDAANKAYVDSAIASAITETLSTAV